MSSYSWSGLFESGCSNGLKQSRESKKWERDNAEYW